jgi:hypothetical protein
VHVGEGLSTADGAAHQLHACQMLGTDKVVALDTLDWRLYLQKADWALKKFFYYFFTFLFFQGLVCFLS